VPGDLEANVNLTSERAKVEYLAGEVEPRELEKAVEGAGYGGMEQMRGMGMMMTRNPSPRRTPSTRRSSTP
jgi:hypothetical protein